MFGLIQAPAGKIRLYSIFHMVMMVAVSVTPLRTAWRPIFLA